MAAVSSTPSAAFEYKRHTCPTCYGHLRDTDMPACGLCGSVWTVATFNTWIESYDRGVVYDLLHGWRWIAPRWLTWFLPHGREGYLWDVPLPCEHPFTALRYVKGAVCRTCRGVGTVASLELSRRYRERVSPAQRPNAPHYPAIAPMRQTPLLAENVTPLPRTYDWQRGRWW